MSSSAGGRPDYSPREIRQLLANYALLMEGKLPVNYSRGKVRMQNPFPRAPFQLAKELQTDIDRAVQRLPANLRFIILSLDICNFDIDLCAYWIGSEVRDIVAGEQKAVGVMVKFLNKGNQARIEPSRGA